MYCSQCGKQIPDDSIFCRYCGTKVNVIEERKTENRYEVNDDEILLTYNPEFHGGYVIKKLIPLFIFFSIFFSFLISFIRGFLFVSGIFIESKTTSMYDQLPGFTHNSSPSSPFQHFFQFQNFLIGIFISFMLVIVFGYNITKKRYQHSVYQFYKDRMEYIDGYFNYNKKQVYYKNIQELSMSQSVFQRKYCIGSIRITTSGVTYSNNRAYSNGITIYDLGDIDTVYSELKRLNK
ncbi:zinc-ribbon domain-containing protein [Mycoplasmatota bacterium]|nr:zinc-ribbon domain-containing protein [Mycoplasmatota bacterium]